MNSHWRYNWLPLVEEGAGASIVLFALLVLIVCTACR